MRNLLLIALLLYITNLTSFGQNCSINAGLNSTICLKDTMKLNGTRSGLFSPNSKCIWTQISGPPATIVQPDSLMTEVTGISPGVYSFKLNNVCKDGIISEDNVSIEVLPVTIADAGNDTILCPGSNNTLNGNIPLLPDETGYWTIISNGIGVTIKTPTNPKSLISLSETNSGITTLRWTIMNNNGCLSFDDVIITNSGGVSQVNAGQDQILENCLSSSGCTKLEASNGGIGLGNQIGIWSVVSGPTVPVIKQINSPSTLVCNLEQGSYVFRYTVTGKCVNGSDDVVVTVPPVSQNIPTVSAGKNSFICDGISAITLSGNIPSSSNTEVNWTQTSGPINVEINSPNNPSTLVSGLTLPGIYTFKYSILNTVSGCSGSSEVRIVRFEYGTLEAGPDQLLPCNVNETKIEPKITGYGTLSFRIIDGPKDAFKYPTAIQYYGFFKGLKLPGTYKVEVNYQFGPECPSLYDYVNITVSLTPTGANAGSYQNFACSSTKTQLAGNNPILTGAGSGVWSQVSGPNKAILVNPNNYICDIAGTVPGVYTFRWSISAGTNCPDNFDDIVVVSPDSTVTKANAGSDKIVCVNSPIVLSGNRIRADEIINWTAIPSAGVQFLPSNSIANPEVTGLKPNTIYSFIYTIRNSCDSISIDTVKIGTSSISGPSQAIAGPNQCLPLNTNVIQLNGNQPASGTGIWTQIFGAPCTINNPNLFNSTVSSVKNGTYKFLWTISVDGCINYTEDSVTITISGNTTLANAGPDIAMCGSEQKLNGNIPEFGIGQWTQISGNGNAIIESLVNPSSNVKNLTTGLYNFRWTISNDACPSSFDDVTLNISSSPSAAAAGPDQVLCGNVTSAKLNATIPASGTGRWVWVSGNGAYPIIDSCNSPNAIVSKLTSGTHKFKWIVTGGPGCQASEDDLIINVSSTANAGLDKNLCDENAISLSGNIGSKGIWSQISGPSANIIQIPVDNPTANIYNLLPASAYTFRYSVPSLFGCPASFDDVIIKNNPVITPDAGKDEIYCGAVSFVLNGNKPGQNETGTWTLLSNQPGCTFVPNKNDPNATLKGVTNGIYILQWAITNGSCSKSVIKKIENVDLPTKAFAGNDDTICLANSYKLNANLPLHGLGKWTQISGPNTIVFQAPSNPESLVIGLKEGTYRFKWSITNSKCSESSDEVQITVLNNPDIANAGNDKTICGTSTELNANTPSGRNMCKWTQISGPNAAIYSSLKSPSNTISNLIPGVYKFVWKIFNERCHTDDTIEIKVNKPVVVFAGNDITICNQNTAVVLSNASVSGSTTIGRWTIVSGDGKLSSKIPTTNPAEVVYYPPVNFTGSVILKLTAEDDCMVATDEIKINFVSSSINVIAQNDSIFINPNNSVTIDVLQNDYSASGEVPKLCNSSILVRPSHGSAMVNGDGTISYKPLYGYMGLDSFNYKLCNETLKNDSTNILCGSIGSDNAWVYITVDGCIIPNSFSPDGDGVNDYFEIPCGAGKIYFNVFNRWGIELYQNPDYRNDWDGTYNGSPLPEGTYFYNVKYSSDKENKFNKSGFITIRR